MSHVDLGFSEDCEKWQIESSHFPSKIGGKPAWLEYENLPTLSDLQCEKCNAQMIFLCQIYAPYEESQANFHRTIFIFICKNPECCEDNNVKAFRSNISRKNNYYSYEPPEEKPINFDSGKWAKLCNLCGCSGEKNCSKCKTVYCCREHQVIDWKENHKEFCGKSQITQSKYLFKEFEIVMEAEDAQQANQVDEAKEMQNYEQLKAAGNVGTLNDASDTELEEHAFTDNDKVFTQFRKKIALNPEQILRYERGGNPLWIAKDPLPETIPDCEYCRGPRQFEFQIMPQLLTVIKENELDFGTLVIYTCTKSCFEKIGYKKEFVFRQNVSKSA